MIVESFVDIARDQAAPSLHTDGSHLGPAQRRQAAGPGVGGLP